MKGAHVETNTMQDLNSENNFKSAEASTQTMKQIR